MATFELFIDDDRYAVPTLKILAAVDESCARALAKQAFGESSHHVGVELYGEDRRLLGLGSLRRAPASAPHGRSASF